MAVRDTRPWVIESMGISADAWEQHSAEWTSGDSCGDNMVDETYFEAADAAQKISAALISVAKGPLSDAQYLPVYVLVGATSSTGDAIGPFVGWFLKRKGFTGEYLGDLDAPVDGKNIPEKLNEVQLLAQRRHKFPYIIAVDAAIGTSGCITVNRGPLRPGIALDKKLPHIGDVHIMASAVAMPWLLMFANLKQTVAMAEVIADGLIAFHQQYVAASAAVADA